MGRTQLKSNYDRALRGTAGWMEEIRLVVNCHECKSYLQPLPYIFFSLKHLACHCKLLAV